MANRSTCLVCRGVVRLDAIYRLPIHRQLCPEHKRLRNRMQRFIALRLRAADRVRVTFNVNIQPLTQAIQKTTAAMERFIEIAKAQGVIE